MRRGCHVIRFLFALHAALIECISYNKRHKDIILFSLSWSNDYFLLCFLDRDKQLEWWLTTANHLLEKVFPKHHIQWRSTLIQPYNTQFLLGVAFTKAHVLQRVNETRGQSRSCNLAFCSVYSWAYKVLDHRFHILVKLSFNCNDLNQ